jgi:chromate reductase
MKILILSTSPRTGSFTLRASAFLKSVLASEIPEAEITLLDFAGFDISPLGKGGFPSDPVTAFQAELLESWQSASLIIFCSPEYNWTASAETFILLERIGNRSFRDFFDNKVFAVAGVSSGRGGRQPALDISRVLSKIIGFLGTESIVSSKILEIHEVGQNLNEQAHSTGNAVFEDSVLNFARYNLRLSRRWLLSNSSE